VREVNKTCLLHNLEPVKAKCMNQGWKEHRYNPAGIPVKIVEMHHDPQSYDMRFVTKF